MHKNIKPTPTASLKDASVLDRILETRFLFPLGVFLSLVITAKLGQYLFFTLEISPAVIWPPTGIALAATFLGGYIILIPIALAHFFISLSNASEPPLYIVIARTIGYTVQPLIGAYLLKRWGFRGPMESVRDVFILLVLGLLLPICAPTISMIARWLMGDLSSSQVTTWGITWAGGVLSIIVLVPLIMTWFFSDRSLTFRKLEQGAAFLALITMTYIAFWTTLPQENSFVVIYLILSVLLWISLRFNMRSMALSIFLLTSLGMSGSIITRVSRLPLNQQLFANELFIILITPIFFILTALVEERRKTMESLKEYVAQVEGMVRKLSRDDQSKNEFLAILAHELRNPLAPVMTTLEILKMRSAESDPSSRELIEQAEQQAATMGHLLDDLLDVARITQKKFKLQKESVALNTTVLRSIAAVENFIHSRKHALTVTLPPEEVWISVDPLRFEQILVNLLNNAGKYTPPGGKIELRCELKGGTLIVIVRDNGIGIDPEKISEIFEPFRQIRTTPHIGSGLGIGLALTKRLVKMHDGNIEASSAGAGKGSTFTVSLPLAFTRQLSILQNTTATPLKNPSSLRILVVDDNEAAADSMGKLLGYRGHTVRLVHAGKEVLDAVREFSPDAIFLDIGLPDMDGYAVVKDLRNKKIEVQIIALTGYGQREDKAKTLQFGFNYHLTKPVSLQEIENILRRIKPERSS